MPDEKFLFAEFEAAFRATCYRVETPGGLFDLRIDRANPAFSAWLERSEVACWFILTACNPGGKALSAESNEARQAMLREKIRLAGFSFHPACNLPDTADWPAEPAFLLLGVNESAVRELASRFGQLAFVAGQSDGVARLVWLTETISSA